MAAEISTSLIDGDDIDQALEQFARASSAGEVLMALQAIARTGHARGTEPFIRALEFTDTALVQVAVKGLIAIGEPAVVPLIECLERVHYGARFQALNALVTIGDPRARVAYEYWIASEITPSARRACVRGLAQFPDTEPLLVQSLADKDWAVRYCAIQVLVDRGLNSRTRLPVEALRDDPERVVRLKLAQVMARS